MKTLEEYFENIAIRDVFLEKSLAEWQAAHTEADYTPAFLGDGIAEVIALMVWEVERVLARVDAIKARLAVIEAKIGID